MKLLLVMKLSAIFLLAATLQVSARSYSQKVSISGKDLSLSRVFELIKQQTGYAFVADQSVLAHAPAVTLNVKEAPLEEVLKTCLRNQALTYTITDNIIVIARSTSNKAADALNSYYVPPAAEQLTGTVEDEAGQPLAGVAVLLKAVKKTVQTDAQGRFVFANIAPGQYTLLFTNIGYADQQLTITLQAGMPPVRVILAPSVNKLDETVVKGYYQTSRKLNTGNVATVKSDDIARQPVGDPLAALQGRVAGLFVNASNGLPGAGFTVRLRGQNSLVNGNDPLYIIDGVPYTSDPLDQFTSANGKQSPLSLINPADIERMDILKDADATAIYGSRGANGVILITTRKGKAGKTQFNFNVYTGGSKVVHMLPMLNTTEYLQMRKEAFANDGITPNADNAPDLFTWSNQQSTDWQKYMFGHTGKVTQATASISGGSAQTHFMFSTTYRKENTVLAGDAGYQRGSAHLNIEHNSNDNRFNITASVNFTTDKNNSLSADITQFYDLSPNYPLYDSTGNYYWFKTTAQNPAAYLERKSISRTTNLLASSTIRYTLLPGLNLKTSLGYNQANSDVVQTYPDISLNPVTSTGSFSYFGNTTLRSYTIEPQVDYNIVAGPGKLQLLAGATWQQSVREGRNLLGENFPSDKLLEDIASAGSITNRNPGVYQFYRYTAGYGRANYNIQDKYIINATFRRDGSTRFGSGRRFGNFGALGAAWIFTNESFFPSNSIVSFGKLRASYGSSGNDQMGGYYDYLDSWSPVSYPYDGVSGLTPSRIANPYFSWERNKKLELALETGFFKDRILLNINYYRNISDNQILDYALSPQAGRPSVTVNFPATVLNTGLELELNTTNIQRKNFTWKTSVNFTLPSNKLQRYDDIANSSYNNVYVVGKSLTIVKGYQFTGVNPSTGVAEFQDVTGDNRVSEYDDYVVMGKTMPDYYGGLQNSFTYKNLQLDFLVQLVHQEGPTVHYSRLASPIGIMVNQDKDALRRWQKAGDITDIPRASLTAGNAAYDAYSNYYRLSTAAWGDASYIRLKNVSLRYDLSSYVKKWKLSGLSVYVLAQNLFTITSYDGFDPETQGRVLPPLKTITAGLQLSF
ncbi:TonB-linked outer membrane protein, SusC/RagA family [Filimonas lacunae]|uniref:TonB-linked outer membrane protein, SusC/RagA family n=1 Tax=Filimonas lacunae TaxID=477680 RepID=A0A173MIE5_9BACT|nr:SusC/RagA family TonB-linked outer membrane protein [Filimonas lacunae]BAV07365.1 outer membrane protein SusC, starch binding [Filimonas lacunae]SIS90683.1 TonB-linked outer membrane protein, SusC/RagA family [Filimonas lacunae]